jgi:arabinofuranosyltransferase
LIKIRVDPRESVSCKAVFRLETFLITGYALLITAAVYRYAWVSEDSFITFRYVLNTLDGYGPVFNPGENVQGYTHPLWFAMLVAGAWIVRNPIYLSIAYGLILTFLTVAIHGFYLLRLTPSRDQQVFLLALTGFVWVRSDSWLSFQTGGLENPLSHLLLLGILIEVWIYAASRPYWLVLLFSLLCLTRPDFLVLVAPLGILLLLRLRSIRELFAMSLPASPLLVWILFAWLFYGEVSPNTAYAKIGIYPGWADGVRQGLLYLQDWLTYDTVMAGSTLLFLGLSFLRSKTKERLSFLVGIALYLVYIVQVGGDFMRGRLLTPVFTAALVAGTFALAERLQHKVHGFRLGAALVAGVLALFVAQQFIPDPGMSIPESGIVDERRYYPGYHLSSLLERGRLKNPYMDLRVADDLKRYSQKCGPATIH